MLRLILKENSFQELMESTIRRVQTHGTAMNTKRAVFFPNIFISYIETQSLSYIAFSQNGFRKLYSCFVVVFRSFPQNLPLGAPVFRHGCIPGLAQHSTEKLSLMALMELENQLEDFPQKK